MAGRKDEDNCADEDPFFQKCSTGSQSPRSANNWMDSTRGSREVTTRFDLPIDLRTLEGKQTDFDFQNRTNLNLDGVDVWFYSTIVETICVFLVLSNVLFFWM